MSETVLILFHLNVEWYDYLKVKHVAIPLAFMNKRRLKEIEIEKKPLKTV